MLLFFLKKTPIFQSFNHAGHAPSCSLFLHLNKTGILALNTAVQIDLFRGYGPRPAIKPRQEYWKIITGTTEESHNLLGVQVKMHAKAKDAMSWKTTESSNRWSRLVFNWKRRQIQTVGDTISRLLLIARFKRRIIKNIEKRPWRRQEKYRGIHKVNEYLTDEGLDNQALTNIDYYYRLLWEVPKGQTLLANSEAYTLSDKKVSVDPSSTRRWLLKGASSQGLPC